ncbi:MAG: ABC transporter substrate-binding protein [Thiothrix sp.]|nr:ABC transporter substrate-binding protein [Thiothrix sp.]HPE62439.1 ABC transporter substrate-binding protein [Thiolinea sp.]
MKRFQRFSANHLTYKPLFLSALLPILSLLLPWTLCSADTGSTSTTPPQRIVSINLCTDQLLLELADPAQIAALTRLSQDAPASYHRQQALNFPTTTGLAEEILPLQPDLVISGEYGLAATQALLRKLHIRIETLPIADDLETVYANITRIAALTGHPKRGAALVARMQQRLQQLPPPPAQRPLAAVYDPNGYTVGPRTLRGQAMALAGWQNAAALLGINDYGVLPLEDMVRLNPVALIASPYSAHTWSRAEAITRHPALRRSRYQRQVITLPSSMTICGGPWSIDVIEKLVRARQSRHSPS